MSNMRFLLPRQPNTRNLPEVNTPLSASDSNSATSFVITTVDSVAQMSRLLALGLALICRAALADTRSHYEVLQVSSTASTPEIRKAYRAAALINHPDKNPGDRAAAEARFIRIAQAYECLKDKAARAAYDRGGGQGDGSSSSSSSMGFGRDFRWADSVFEEDLGETLSKEWQPGMTVSGVLVRDGKRYTITINPDGTTDEAEEATRNRGGGAGGGGYRSVKKVGADGSTSYSINIEGGSGLAELLLPDWVSSLPVLGGVLVAVASWMPLLCCASCCWCVCCRSSGRAHQD